MKTAIGAVAAPACCLGPVALSALGAGTLGAAATCWRDTVRGFLG